MIATLVGLVASVLVLAAVPPVDRDALTHHLVVPKLYLKHGGIVEIPHVPFSYYPMNLDLLYLVPLALGNDIVPKYIHFAFALLTAGLIFSYLHRRLGSRPYGLLGGLMFLSLPVIVKLSVTVYVDLGLIFFSTAALLQLLRWSETHYRLRHLVWSGIFAGLCLGTKPNGLLAAFLLAVTVPFLYSRAAAAKVSSPPINEGEGQGEGDNAGRNFFNKIDNPARRENDARNALKPLGWALLFVAIASLVYAPWMIRNYAWTGNPVYPMAQRIFAPSDSAETDPAAKGAPTGENIDNDAAQPAGGGGFGHFGARKIVFGESLLEIIAIPVRVFLQGQDDNPRLFDGRLNPYLLVFPLVVLLLSRGGNRSSQVRLEMRVLGMFALLHLLFAFFLVDMRIRYISPIIPPLVVLAVIGIHDLAGFCRSRYSGHRRLAALTALGGIVVALLGLNGAYLVRQFSLIDPWSYLGGELSRDEYIQKNRPEHAAITYANRHLPDTARILLLFNGNRIYYLDRETISSPELFRSLVSKSRSPEAVRDELTRRGISHLLVGAERFNHWVGFQFSDREKMMLQALFQKHFKSLYQSHGYVLFQVAEG